MASEGELERRRQTAWGRRRGWRVGEVGRGRERREHAEEGRTSTDREREHAEEGRTSTDRDRERALETTIGGL
jgi:hypothetical protein